MKLALCLTGLMRCWKDSFPSIKENILDKYETDVFISTWSEVGYYTGKGYLPEVGGFVVTKQGEKGFYESGELINSAEIFDLYRPKILHVENFTDFEPIAEQRKEYFKNAWTRPKNTISQAYMMYRGVQQIQMYQQISDTTYDIVFRTRPDITFKAPLQPLEKNVFYTLAAKNKNGGGTGDWFQIGSQEQIENFTTFFYSKLETMYDVQGVSCPHLYVQNTIQSLALPWKELHTKIVMNHSPTGEYQEPDRDEK